MMSIRKCIQISDVDKIWVVLDAQHPENPAGIVSSTLHLRNLHKKKNYYPGWEAAVDTVEAMVLAHACLGIDIEAPAYVTGVKEALSKAGEYYGD